MSVYVCVNTTFDLRIHKLVRVLEEGVGVEEKPVGVGDAEANDLVGLGC